MVISTLEQSGRFIEATCAELPQFSSSSDPQTAPRPATTFVAWPTRPPHCRRWDAYAMAVVPVGLGPARLAHELQPPFPLLADPEATARRRCGITTSAATLSSPTGGGALLLPARAVGAVGIRLAIAGSQNYCCTVDSLFCDTVSGVRRAGRAEPGDRRRGRQSSGRKPDLARRNGCAAFAVFPSRRSMAAGPLHDRRAVSDVSRRSSARGSMKSSTARRPRLCSRLRECRRLRSHPRRA